MSGIRKMDEDDDETRHASGSVRLIIKLRKRGGKGKRVIYFLPPAAIAARGWKSLFPAFDTAANARTVATL